MGPYEILGVSPSTTDDDIAKAYKKLARKFHPDINPGNDSAARKMAEINNAYDQIKQMRSGNTTNGYSGSYSNTSQNPYRTGNNQIRFVEEMIRIGQYIEALSLLSNIPSHDAQWHYLYGVCLANLGRYQSARNYIRRAIEMDPYKTEYQEFLNQINNTQYQEPAQVGFLGRFIFTALKWVFYFYLFQVFINFLLSGFGRR